MKVGDLVRYRPGHRIDCLIDKFGSDIIGILLYNNKKGGTLKLMINDCVVYWAVTGDCEVISECR